MNEEEQRERPGRPNGVAEELLESGALAVTLLPWCCCDVALPIQSSPSPVQPSLGRRAPSIFAPNSSSPHSL